MFRKLLWTTKRTKNIQELEDKLEKVKKNLRLWSERNLTVEEGQYNKH